VAGSLYSNIRLGVTSTETVTKSVLLETPKSESRISQNLPIVASTVSPVQNAYLILLSEELIGKFEITVGQTQFICKMSTTPSIKHKTSIKIRTRDSNSRHSSKISAFFCVSNDGDLHASYTTPPILTLSLTGFKLRNVFCRTDGHL
jgi:hypothetical protein